MATPGHRPSIRRALVIGIEYRSAAKEMQLRAPHSDAKAWKQFVIDNYGYRDKDVTLMLDEPGFPLQPTKEQILAQIDKFVSGVQAGDHLMFYYSGHSTQYQCVHGTEEDFMDEGKSMIPSDSQIKDNISEDILDNELRKRLVDPLPVGACLIAILDTCHSGTILDLDHYKCNDIRQWLPMKAIRTLSLPLKPLKRASSFLLCSSAESACHHIEPAGVHESLVHNTESNPVERRVTRRKQSRKASLLLLDPVQETPVAPGDASKQSPRRSDAGSGSCARCDRKLNKPKRSQTMGPMTEGLRDMVGSGGRILSDKGVCSEPEDSRCNGECVPTLPKTKADVFSISAARDPELTWEGKSGQTMTRSLMEVLRKDPHPRFHDLVADVGKSMFESTTMPLRRWFLRKWKKWVAGRLQSKPTDVEMGSAPQLGSSNRLTGEERFEITPTPADAYVPQ